MKNFEISTKNQRVFKYKGVIHIVSEVKENLEGFTGCFMKMHGVKCCLINSNLSPIKKQRTLHNLIKEKHLFGGN